MSQDSDSWHETDIEPVIGHMGGFSVPLHYSGKTDESLTLRNGIGLINYTPVGYLKVSGQQSLSFLQRVFSRDLRFLRPIHHTSVSGLFLDENAELVGDGNVYVLDDCYIVETWLETRNDVQGWLTRHASNFDVVLDDLTEEYAVIGIEGPYAWQLVGQVVDFDVIGLRYRSWRYADICGFEGIITRTGWTAEYGYKLFVPVCSANEIWRTIAEIGNSHGAMLCGTEAIELSMLEMRFPNIARDYQVSIEGFPRMTPWESGLIWMVDPQKTEFIGSTALRDHRSLVSTKVLGFVGPTDRPLASTGQKIVLKESHQEIGNVIRATVSYALGQTIGLALLNWDFAVPGLEVRIIDGEGNEVSLASTVSAPFLVPQSWKVKLV